MTLSHLEIKAATETGNVYLNHATTETSIVETARENKREKDAALQSEVDKNLPMYAPSKMPRIF